MNEARRQYHAAYCLVRSLLPHGMYHELQIETYYYSNMVVNAAFVSWINATQCDPLYAGKWRERDPKYADDIPF